MRTIPVETQVVDMTTGNVVETRTTPFMLMPPRPGTCEVCGREHDPQLPHDAQQLYYQYAFYGATGRWPTWADAVAHCAPNLQTKWKEALLECHKWTEPAEGLLPVPDLGPVTK
jgi:hypothetical protein